MATTSPDNLRTPDPGDPYNLVPDLATLAGDVQTALLLRDNNTGSGTASQRTAFTSSAPDGFLWQDTDGIKMIWRKDGAVWVPAVWHWSGTNTQMTGFAPPDGFEWFNTTDNIEYVRLGGAWVEGVTTDLQLDTTNSRERMITQSGIGYLVGEASVQASKVITFPRPFASVPVVTANFMGMRAGAAAFNPIGVPIFGGGQSSAQLVTLTGATIVTFATVAMSAANKYYFSWTAMGRV